MYNPNSAIERVKNHLAYKLGQAMIDFTNNGGGYIALFKKLYKIKKQHKKEQKIYQQTIQVFPQLKYPSLEACSDYKQALRYKFHLSYMLGEVLIKAYQTWYTGGGFKLKNNIKKANKEFQIFREIFREFDQINSSILEGLIDNKQLFLKEFSRIKNILKIHQDYKAILDNIFHNFNYFIQNFDLIEEWLLSDDFNERYKKENHPYPSLLDPKKLNDKNEKINYHNIPAELAWEMNLPLPDKYKFVYWCSHGTGGTAFMYFMEQIGFKTVSVAYDDALKSFLRIYDISLTFYDNAYLTVRNYISSLNGDKLYSLMQIKYGINISRDPIEMLKHYICMKREAISEKKIFTILHNPKEVVRNLVYYHDSKNLCYNMPNIDEDNIKFWLNLRFSTFHDSQLRKKLICIRNDMFFDMKDFTEENIVKSVNKIIKYFNLKPENQLKKTFQIMSNNFSYLPIILSFHDEDLKLTDIDTDFLKRKGSVEFFIVDKNFVERKNNYVILKRYWFANFYKFTKELCFDVTNLFDTLDNDILVVVQKEHFNKLSKSKILLIKQYLNTLFLHLEKEKKNTKINSKHLLEFIQKNYYLKFECKKVFDRHLSFIKQHRPDIVLSWKYYQEFEKAYKHK
ncbi:hypothetical protein AJ935_02135 [Campylobacter sp. BCW_6876]|nr:hypothetical protein AJ935_02135 [Campylobacter sp. BCW_6876]